ncbi:Non-heme chloroperoxidase [Actinomadura rubteroloni]|uniref:Non-heme chloroperoxidase n=1 Tax=Actinomadura rubteroloni TaxID=1926885 RepID=A0A2P4UMK7_9ACTN|nr:alpha/beta fold hydrolase [Actinomadura rubteroloni]POM26282.1 Non-heme chloroperoxidase [Actinomadura rubteroloni]
MSTVTSADGTLIDYDRHGDGPAVVFIGGATQFRAIDPRTAEAVKRLGDEGFTAVNYDRRGRGPSGDTAPWSLDREVEDVAALIEAVGGAATLYSSSSGATVALAAATADVGVTALALYEPPFFAGVDQAHHIDVLRGLLAEGRNEDAMRYNMSTVIGVPAEIVDGMAAEPWWPTMISVAPTLVYDLSAVHEINTDPDWRARWADVTVPAIVYSGDRTFPGMPEAADATAAALPNAARRILPGQDHGPSPDALIPVLVEFLRG